MLCRAAACRVTQPSRSAPRSCSLNIWSNIALTFGAALFEAAIGYPDALFRAIRHPVVWFGALLTWLERRLNRPAWSALRRRALGIVSLVVLLLATVLPALALQLLLLPTWPGFAVLVLAASVMPAQRSLWVHVRDVADAIERDGLAAGRTAVSHIVGRDPTALDEAGVVRAAIESLAENFSDGVVAPLFWGAVAGLPGMAAYKAINTADSMIGHRSERYAAFGWASARLDDLVNLPASRLAAALLAPAAVLMAGDPRSAWRAVWRDAGRHRSPNAGWPEAAMAGALGLRLNGPRVYGGTRVEDAWIGEGRAAATPADLRRALGLYRAACGIQLAVLCGLAILTWPG